MTICEKGDNLMEQEMAKVYRGKKVPKGVFSVVIESSLAKKKDS